MKQPNFFIVGAPKCGTTALSEYLRSHSQIFMCTPKEPHYFALDFPRYRHVADWSSYQSLFSGASRTDAAIGEASVFYLYSNTAAEGIKKVCPAAKLLVLLRNPVDLAVSMHAQSFLSGVEDARCFETAWGLCEQRRNGRSMPCHYLDAKVLFYDRLPFLGFQLQRLLSLFPREQVCWWFYDDFSADPARVYSEALEFLGVSDDGRHEFPRVNGRKRPRSQWLVGFTQHTPAPLLRSAMHVKTRLGIERWGVLDILRRINSIPAQSTEITPALTAEMRTHFAPDIRLLESITGRNLDHWLQETP
jgi:hypothetical protein